MTGAEVQRRELKNTGYEIFIGILSMLSIVNLVLLYAIEDDALDTVLWVMNAILSAIFLADFTYRLLTAPSRTRYFFRKFGWADLLASLPVPAGEDPAHLPPDPRLPSAACSTASGTSPAACSRTAPAARSSRLLLMGILVLEFGSLWILDVEQNAPGANITTASDALWYTIVTISTVGYGDRYPVTNEGRVIGSLIIVVGVGIFGTFTGYLANVFLSPSKHAAAGSPPPTTSDAQLDVGQLRAVVAHQQAAMDEMNLLLQGGRPEDDGR